ncbi:hypothetical protein C7437_101664 [Psychrobacillus insolitus]|uniref:Uncharacterized protein n=1 Tax=Psychrobacillus insolitus TaxID=1461 RepID=A0A2W7PGZ1_9BACI|nr:hypothetical protein C7437_101664 [Psychrobacillus insolitus]
MNLTICKNKYFSGVLWILAIALLAVSLLTHAYSYFNTKEINLFSTECYENDGEVILEIHNNITGEYSFECKK